MITFTRNSLPAYIELLRATSDDEGEAEGVIAPDLAHIIEQGSDFYVHRNDSNDTELILIGRDALDHLTSKGPHSLQRALERIDRVAREFANPPLYLPDAWSKYQHDGLVAFFALPIHLDEESLRWIAHPLESGDASFCELTLTGGKKPLAEHRHDHQMSDGIKRLWAGARTRGQSLLPAPATGVRVLQPSVDLDVVGISAISRERPYSVWEPELNAQQREILLHPGPGPLKVRGPAGTGKTLVLQLKAIKELYDASDEGKDLPRILYLTHSMALADLVDRSLHVIDERGLAFQSIDVMPLTWVRELLYGHLPDNVEVLGSDSLEGKRDQMRLISEAIDDLLLTDWPTYREKVSGHIAAGIESDPDSEERIVLCWMLMREFAEVIDANRLRPGLNTLQRYLDIPRADWMVDLPGLADREFVYAVYRRFVARLVGEGQLTTDQALDDFRNYLQQYAWNIRRAYEGYDLILVDEFHLFNDTERYLIHLLTRDPNAPPRLLLALDPHQSAFTLLTGLADGSLSRQAQENLEPEIDVQQVDLQTVHRFSEPVLQLVRMIYESFPNLVDIGEDWTFDFASTVSGVDSGIRPVVENAVSESAAIASALSIAESRNDSSSDTERTALIGTGVNEFQALLDALPNGEPGHRITAIRSRDDLDQLKYSRRSLVIGASEYCAGLQFAHVVVLTFSDRTNSHGSGASAARASLSELYLAVTRAELSVTVVTSGDEGPVGQLLKRAVEVGIADANS